MITVDTKSFLKGMAQLESKVKTGVTLQGKVAADKMASYAKMTAPWTDRTGLARKSISPYTKWEDASNFRVGISGGMDYSPYLEFCNDKKFAILYPTVLRYKNEVLRTFYTILK